MWRRTKRRFGISAPKLAVRPHIPWYLRWSLTVPFVLAALGLPREALALALVGFNVGVEIGQLAIVLLFLPLAFAIRRTSFYRRWVMLVGSLAIAALAGAWFVERAFAIKLIGL